MRAHRRPPLPAIMEWLLPVIAERRPELAERLGRLRRHSPERFQRLLADALVMRLEEALEREERRPFSPGERPRGPRPPMPAARAEIEARERAMLERLQPIHREMMELERRNEELERRSMELAHRFRELRERREPEMEAERNEVRHHLQEAVQEHFEVRTELRRMELRRVEMELDRLRELLERIRHDLERREEARGTITERRIKQMLGEDAEGW